MNEEWETHQDGECGEGCFYCERDGCIKPGESDEDPYPGIMDYFPLAKDIVRTHEEVRRMS